MPPRLYAHRGAAAERPENTLPSFRRALELGADALETDLHMTSDGHVVVAHDPDGARMCGVAAEIRRSTLAEVQKWDAGWGFMAGAERPYAGKALAIPTLGELLEECPGVLVNVDLKQREPDMVPAVLALVDRMAAAARVLIASFSSRTLRRVRTSGYRGATSLGREEVLALTMLPVAALKRLGLGNAAQVPVAAGPLNLATPAFLQKSRALGLRVDYWTINDPAQARELVALGADGIMTDDPARVAAAVKA